MAASPYHLDMMLKLHKLQSSMFQLEAALHLLLLLGLQLQGTGSSTEGWSFVS